MQIRIQVDGVSVCDSAQRVGLPAQPAPSITALPAEAEGRAESVPAHPCQLTACAEPSGRTMGYPTYKHNLATEIGVNLGKIL